jgi:CheY-like chemotaxis protein
MQEHSAAATILVVDDSDIVLELARVTLEKAGFRVITHQRAEGTVAAVIRERPDLILLDVNMPRLAGDSLAGALTKANPGQNTIVLLHSTLPPDVLRIKAQQAGAHGFIQKTSSAEDLLAQLNHWLKRTASGTMRSVKAIHHADVAHGPADAAGSSHPPDQATRPPNAGSGKIRISQTRVLFVDDDLATLLALKREMSDHDLQAEFLSSPEEALRRINGSEPPDVIVSDILMPRLSGIELYRLALEKDLHCHHRFVFITGARLVGFVADFLRESGVRVLYKPIDSARLRAIIHQVAAAGRLLHARSASDG